MLDSKILILAFSIFCMVAITLSKADEVETVSIEDEGDGTEEIVTKEEKIIETVPAPPPPSSSGSSSSSMEIEHIETEKVDNTGPDLVKLTKRIEEALNAVIAKVIQRKKEIAAHLKRFDQGMVNIIRLLGAVRSRRKRETIETRQAEPDIDDDDDDDDDDEQDIPNEEDTIGDEDDDDADDDNAYDVKDDLDK